MRKTIWVSVLFLLLSAAIVTSQETEIGTYDDTARSVEKEIRKAKKVQIEDLKVLHDKGTIYLYGVTDTYGSRYEAEKKAKKVDAVTNIVNEIGVKSGNVSDTEIEAETMKKIRSRLKGTPFDLVSIRVNNGIVNLTGNVRDASLIEDALEEVMWIRGVRGVVNKIEPASISAGDERLRQGIYRRLNREFPQYFIGRDPSVLILVNSGRVRLVGYVDSNVSKEKIGSIVRSFTGVLSVENELQTS